MSSSDFHPFAYDDDEYTFVAYDDNINNLTAGMMGFGVIDVDGENKVEVQEVPFGSDAPVFSSLPDMSPIEGFAVREWRRQNAIILEEKEQKEKDLRSQIIAEAEEYRKAFYEKRKLTCAANKTLNREREKLFLANEEKFHANADKQYWKAIAELIPGEVPNIEKKRGKKDQEKKPSIVVVQGPKPGQPTDLSRMRQILGKLKHSLPPHMQPPIPASSLKDGDAASSSGVKVTAKEPAASGISAAKEAIPVMA